MTAFMQQSLLDAVQRAPQWIEPLQARSRVLWADTVLPTRRMESWKYTSLAALRNDYLPAPSDTVATVELPERLRAGFGGPRLVFVDGVYQPSLSSARLPAGVQCCRFSEADAEQSQRIAQHLGSAADGSPQPFAALNGAALVDGVFVAIDEGAQVEEPIECLWLLSAAEHPIAVSQRLLVLAGKQSESRIIEHFAALDGAQPSFTNGVSELLLQPGARLSHYRLHEEDADAIHVGAVHVRLERDATLDAFHLAFGSRLKRLDIVVHHAGPGAHAGINGIYLPRGDEHIDYHTTMEHAVPHCTSDEVFRGIIGDRASAVFNGRIHIHPQAQKTHAQLSNKNLLTSTEAQINTKPELEIYADDVQCAHGATVAQLDAMSLHYLRSRGLSRAEAELMLSFGFINELIDELSLDALRDYLRPLLARRFGRDQQPSEELT